MRIAVDLGMGRRGGGEAGRQGGKEARSTAYYIRKLVEERVVHGGGPNVEGRSLKS